MICEYSIRMAKCDDLLVILPEIIALTIEKVRCSDRRKLMIPVEEILVQDYVEYLFCVLRANKNAGQQTGGQQQIYGWIAEQITDLTINHHKCFDKFCLCKFQCNTQFDITASEMFYMLVKQEKSKFFYIYKDLYGKEVKISLTNIGNI